MVAIYRQNLYIQSTFSKRTLWQHSTVIQAGDLCRPTVTEYLEPIGNVEDFLPCSFRTYCFLHSLVLIECGRLDPNGGFSTRSWWFPWHIFLRQIWKRLALPPLGPPQRLIKWALEHDFFGIRTARTTGSPEKTCLLNIHNNILTLLHSVFCSEVLWSTRHLDMHIKLNLGLWSF